MKHYSAGKWVAAALLGGCSLVGRAEDLSRIPAPPLLDVARQLNEAFVRVAEEASKSVVVIRVAHEPSPVKLEAEADSFWDTVPREFRRRFEKDPSEGRLTPEFDGQGSGVIVRKEGYILTNRHVVDGAETIKVRFADGRESEARIHGMDVQSDLAVIKVDEMEGLAEARLGSSSRVRVGEFAIAIGAPFELDYSVTFGHVSAKGRSYIIPDPTLDQDFIQTDANINPGNSGGPLMNLDGEVIGINTLIRGLRTGIGFAIPIDLAREVADHLIESGHFNRAWLGIGIRALRNDPDYRAMVQGIGEGVIVTEILPAGPAAKSELKPSDIIIEVDGEAVGTEQQLKNLVRSKKVGSGVRLRVHRMGQELEITVRPEAWPEEDILAAVPTELEVQDPKNPMGLTVRTTTRALAKDLGVEYVKGLIVTDIEPRSPASLKIRVGDIITEVDRRAVRTPEDFREAMARGNSSHGIILNFVSRGTSKFEILKE